MTITEELPLPGPALRAEDVPALCEALAARYRRGVREVVCDLSALTRPGLPTLDALARLALTARRQGGSLRLTGIPPGLAALLDLTGLAELFAPGARDPNRESGPRLDPDAEADGGRGRDPEPGPGRNGGRLGEPFREAEEGEPPVGVEEGVEPHDPPA
ncbi:STAS domain-containing protein [Streptomyces sp. NRRL S-87]|uniref:STAS domain-containing protein n=1 Tax=Streptomyces sp. NRRL S-87 TaxID=1463920 RepID=UPI0007C45433|nr:STAS domain-containing protein [Streptomyces sp. NRRL S-87]